MLRPKILPLIIALVWLANGLLAKVFNLVPPHTEIVGNILGEEYARPLTVLILPLIHISEPTRPP